MANLDFIPISCQHPSRLMERREALGPALLGPRASQRKVVHGFLLRGARRSRSQGSAYGCLANTLAPPGAPFLRAKEKKGTGVLRAFKNRSKCARLES